MWIPPLKVIFLILLRTFMQFLKRSSKIHVLYFRRENMFLNFFFLHKHYPYQKTIMVHTVLSQNKSRIYNVLILVYILAFQKKNLVHVNNKLKTVLSCSIAQLFQSVAVTQFMNRKKIYIGLVRYVYKCKNKSWNKNIKAY